ncbi:unnamed protein product [Adineta ricciae]|uniref:Uncharacterized protein n=1 Tax=Adineta ricciae TaxID=249248 RepID=A0A814W7D3_ADIRI|nr:unnamed protein product [Adineta ricciae]
MVDDCRSPIKSTFNRYLSVAGFDRASALLNACIGTESPLTSLLTCPMTRKFVSIRQDPDYINFRIVSERTVGQLKSTDVKVARP